MNDVSNPEKYVNMADINPPATGGPSTPAARRSAVAPQDGFVEIIELLFFAYRDFVSDPDAILSEYAFGRAHHRVLHFVNRNPGLTVADLLDILKITKQSLGRVLKELVDSGFIEQRTGPQDRRQRLLYTTETGAALARGLSEPQSRRIRAALEGLDPAARDAVTKFLFGMVDAGERAKAARLARSGSGR
jgi:DNA-binding MarR family transcriptional regulator